MEVSRNVTSTQRAEGLTEIARHGFNGCGFAYFSMCAKRDANQIHPQVFERWYDSHCAKCPCMHEICMADEVLEHVNGGAPA